MKREPFSEGEIPTHMQRVGVLNDRGEVVRWSHVTEVRTTTHEEPEAVLADGSVHSIYHLCPL